MDWSPFLLEELTMPQGPGRVTSGDMGGNSDLNSELNRLLGHGLRPQGYGAGFDADGQHLFDRALLDERRSALIQEKLSHLMPIAQRLAAGVSGGLPQQYGPKGQTLPEGPGTYTKYTHGMGNTADANSRQIIELLWQSLGSQKPIQPSVLPLEIGPESVTQEARQVATAQEQVSRLFR